MTYVLILRNWDFVCLSNYFIILRTGETQELATIKVLFKFAVTIYICTKRYSSIAINN